MSKYREKDTVVEAEQFLPKMAIFPSGVVQHPNPDRRNNCDVCGEPWDIHGRVGPHVVCPGDWIITGIRGEIYPCKPEIFEATYETAE